MGIKRRTEEKIVEILREAEKSELSVADMCYTYGNIYSIAGGTVSEESQGRAEA